MSRKTVKVESLAASGRYSLVGGPFGSKLTSSDYVEEGIPVVRGSNLNGGRYLDETEFVFVSEQKMREDLFGNLAHRGDVVFTQRGTLGQTALIPLDACFDAYVISQSQMKLTVDPKKADPRYLYYYFSSREAVQKILNQSSSSGVPHINLTTLRNFLVPQVPLREQKKIADVLSAYDDLIENNRRRIALVEEAARLLYREWFVHLRFPGHEHVKATDGLPEGWSKHPVSDLADIFRGKSYRSSELVDSDGQPFINLKCVDRFGGFRIYGLKWFRGEHLEHHLAMPGDVLIAVTDMTRSAMIVAQAARVPRTVGDNAVYSMDLVKAIPRTGIEPEWFYGMLRFSQFSAVVREEATGATVLHLKPKHIENWEAVVPPTTLRRLFSEQFSAILEQVDNLELQNANCAKARDFMLPRLMNGEIEV